MEEAEEFIRHFVLFFIYFPPSFAGRLSPILRDMPEATSKRGNPTQTHKKYFHFLRVCVSFKPATSRTTAISIWNVEETVNICQS